jgi:hypothetical protein
MLSETISLISVTIALVAVCLTAWQARANMLNAVHSRSLPVLSDSMSQFRSPDFRESIVRLVQSPDLAAVNGGFKSIPDGLTDDAYKVCYFFDLIGILVVFEIIREDIVIGLFGAQAMRVWLAMWPAIKSERDCRLGENLDDVSPGFLVYYEHLVARIRELGGKDSASILQRRIGVHHLP